MGEAFSGVDAAGGEFVMALAETTSSSAESCMYVTARTSEVQIASAIAESKQQGWSELARAAGDGAGSTSCGLSVDDLLLWQQLKEGDRSSFADIGDRLVLGRVIAEGGQAIIYEADTSYFRFDDVRLVTKVYKLDGFSLADLQR